MNNSEKRFLIFFFFHFNFNLLELMTAELIGSSSQNFIFEELTVTKITFCNNLQVSIVYSGFKPYSKWVLVYSFKNWFLKICFIDFPINQLYLDESASAIDDVTLVGSFAYKNKFWIKINKICFKTVEAT